LGGSSFSSASSLALFAFSAGLAANEPKPPNPVDLQKQFLCKDGKINQFVVLIKKIIL